MVRVEERQGFFVAGVKTRTSNAREMGGAGEIGRLWDRFTASQLGARVKERGEDAYGVYFDYESDENGEYSLMAAAKVDELEGVPAGVEGLAVPAGRYAVVTSDRGPLYEVVPRVWARVWKMSEEELGGTRTFQVDYEVYDSRAAADPRNAQVELYVGVK